MNIYDTEDEGPTVPKCPKCGAFLHLKSDAEPFPDGIWMRSSFFDCPACDFQASARYDEKGDEYPAPEDTP